MPDVSAQACNEEVVILARFAHHTSSYPTPHRRVLSISHKKKKKKIPCKMCEFFSIFLIGHLYFAAVVPAVTLLTRCVKLPKNWSGHYYCPRGRGGVGGGKGEGLINVGFKAAGCKGALLLGLLRKGHRTMMNGQVFVGRGQWRGFLIIEMGGGLRRPALPKGTGPLAHILIK